MELYAPNGEFSVSKPHDFAFGGLGCDLEAVGEALTFDDERMVASGFDALGESAEEVLVVVADGGSLAVHEAVGANDFATKVLTDGLVSEADSEERDLAGEGFDHRDGYTGFGWRAGTWGNEDALGFEGEGFFDGDLVVSEDALLDAESTEVLDEVESEGIVVVDDKQHDGRC